MNASMYINILIYTIILSTVFVALSFVGMSPVGQPFLTLLICLNVGIFFTIIYCLRKVINHENSKQKRINEYARKKVQIDTCPDHFVVSKSKKDKNHVVCDGFVSLDVKGGKVNSYRLGDKFETKQISEFGKENTMAEFCNAYTNYKEDMYDFAWTDLKSKCDLITS